MKRVFFILAAMLFGTAMMPAQVTIGADKAPEKFSVLELVNSSNDKGLRMPHITTGQRDLMTDDDFKASKLSHGLHIYNTDTGCEEFWNGKEWKSLCGELGAAKFDSVSCSDIQVNGDYIEDDPTNSANFLTIKLNVTEPGLYSIAARTGNGYSFFLSGTALNEGVMLVNIPCQGTPHDIRTDTLAFSGIMLVSGCKPTVTVESAISGYSLNCASVTVHGTYLKGTALTSANYITMSVMVRDPGSFHISTVQKSGITFTGSGIFATVGTHSVTLYGSGTPTLNEDIPIEIQANTETGNADCNALIPITLPAMTYAVIGSGDYSWATVMRTVAFNGSSFGPGGKVKMVNFDHAWIAYNASSALSFLNGATKPDIILYFAYGAPPTVELSVALADYIRNGGVVIYGAADDTEAYVNILMNGLFGMSTAAIEQSGGSGDDNVYPISDSSSDPIINGPFGNLSGKYWGEDNAQAGSVIMTELPANSVQVATARSTTNTTRSPEHSIVWYNDSYNSVYFGDCVAAARPVTTVPDGYPAIYSDTGVPMSKSYGPVNFRQYVYNSALELNAIAWGIRKAAINGINPH